ncbi:putative translocation complex subunit sss1 protein [Lasiodiplodia theobromae]|nr:putative translocation complex subunit sss1 protein [Lasiodiplodia theobromae]
MSDQIKELADVPKDFIKDGTQFINSASRLLRTEAHSPPVRPKWKLRVHSNIATADKREFIKISQAVGVGFVVMGAIGYIVKLVHIPVNNILVGGS